MMKIVLSICLVILSFFVGFFVSTLKETAYGDIPIRQGGYAYINPLLECEVAQVRNEKKIAPFKHRIERYINDKLQASAIGDIAVYFRDLNNGSWFGIHEDDQFTPASLLKLPLLIAYYKKAQEDKSFLEQKIAYSGDAFEEFIVQNVSPSALLQQDKTYIVEDLLHKMIVYSDNNAMLLLFTYMNKDFYTGVYRDLGIKVPDIQNPDNYMSVKEYAEFFRILFNASYLTKEFSDRALRLLAQVEFKKGIGTGIPKNILVAHKFGERSIKGDTTKQFHDCGIVYYPDHPYLLCMMTRGENFTTQENIIGEVSRLVYQEVDALHTD